jgi:hypothetical protein
MSFDIFDVVERELKGGKIARVMEVTFSPIKSHGMSSYLHMYPI